MSDNSSDPKIDKWLASIDVKKTRREYLHARSQQVAHLQQQADFIEKVALYSALGNKIRYTIFKLIEETPLCTCVLAEILQFKESTISYHLKILEQANLIVGLKSGSFINYYTKKDALNKLQ